MRHGKQPVEYREGIRREHILGAVDGEQYPVPGREAAPPTYRQRQMQMGFPDRRLDSASARPPLSNAA
ncbi:hypothetical protein AB0J86_33525 [Micromonospora sp. NPDC049559]|uniref:hypothetical protein n=1 Tax=Micromonospora sp. NPDC049559 TaxID=3155923 RepID=UPI003422AD64